MHRQKDLATLIETFKSQTLRISDEDWPAFFGSTTAVLSTQITGFTSQAHRPYILRMLQGRLTNPSRQTGEAFYDFESAQRHSFLEKHLPALKIASGMHSKMELYLVSKPGELRKRVPIYRDWKDISSYDRGLSWHCIVGQMKGFPNYVVGVELFKIIAPPEDSLSQRTENLTEPFTSEWGNDVYWKTGRDIHTSFDSFGKEEQDCRHQLREAVIQYRGNFPKEFDYEGIDEQTRWPL